MKARCIAPEEINEFCSVGLGREDAVAFKTKLAKAWEEKRSSPKWCFVVEEDGRFIARVTFDIFPSEPRNLMVWRYYVQEGEGCLDTGVYLFKSAIEALSGKGLRLIEYHLYGSGDKRFQDQRDLFLGAGFEVRQEKKNFRFTEDRLIELSDRLVFKTLEEVGEEAFVHAIERVTEGTLDSYDEKDVCTMGKTKAAKFYFDGLKDIECNSAWWKLAYEYNQGFVGLIVPQKFTSKLGAINYIGVAPEKRGRGYVKDLLAMGTSTLKSAGIGEIIADIDIHNYPMENALIALGYRFNKNELVLERVL